MTQILTVLRWREWGGNKQGNLAAVMYLQLMTLSWFTLWQGLAAYVGSLAGLCSAYLLNAVADADEDATVGKLKPFARLPQRSRHLVLLSVWAIGALAALATWNPWSALCIAGIFLSGVLYSAGPRWRDRVIAGVVVSVVGQRTLPLAAVLAIGQLPLRVQLPLHVAFVGSGLRGILVHQFLDRDADSQSRHRTLAGAMSESSLRRLLVWVSGIELAAWVVAAFWAWPFFAALIMWAIANVRLIGLWRRWTWEQRVLDYAVMPLNHLYFFFLPVVVAGAAFTHAICSRDEPATTGFAMALGVLTLAEGYLRRDVFLGIVRMSSQVARC